MADGTLWLLTDQGESYTAYVAWLRRYMVTRRQVRHVCVKLLPTPDAMARKLGGVKVDVDPTKDRILLLMDTEGEGGPTGPTMQDARRQLAERFGVADDHVRAYLVPPTTEGWYLLLADLDGTLFDALADLERVNARDLRARVTARRLHADGKGPPPPKEDINTSLGGAGRSTRKKDLSALVTHHVAHTTQPLDQEALPPCLKGVARWLAAWG